jgi:hypothetical protein
MRTLQTPGFKPFPAPQAIPPDGTALLSREVLSGVGHGNKKPPICGRFCFRKEPSNGLEPLTPSLPSWREGVDGSAFWPNQAELAVSLMPWKNPRFVARATWVLPVSKLA